MAPESAEQLPLTYPDGTPIRFEGKISIGPLPPPEVLEQYNRADKNAAKIILESFQKEGNHRRRMESKELDAQINDINAEREETKRGQRFALAFGLSLIIAGLVTIWLGYPKAGIAFMGAPPLGFAGAFIIGKMKSKASKSADS